MLTLSYAYFEFIITLLTQYFASEFIRKEKNRKNSNKSNVDLPSQILTQKLQQSHQQHNLFQIASYGSQFNVPMHYLKVRSLGSCKNEHHPKINFKQWQICLQYSRVVIFHGKSVNPHTMQRGWCLSNINRTVMWVLHLPNECKSSEK